MVSKMAVKEKNKEKEVLLRKSDKLLGLSGFIDVLSSSEINLNKVAFLDKHAVSADAARTIDYDHFDFNSSRCLHKEDFSIIFNEVSLKNYKFFTQRLSEIDVIAEEENISLNSKGYSDFLNYEWNLEQKAPALFLLDNGNLRALWREGQSQIGLQFLGNSLIQYVLIKEGETLQTAYGRVEAKAIMPLIEAMMLTLLLSEKS